MAMSLLLLPAIFISIFLSLSTSIALVSPVDYQSLSSCSDQANQNAFACQLEETRLKIARLELVLEERIGEIIAKTKYFGDSERKIEMLNAEIDRLNSVLSDFKSDRSLANMKLSTLEEDVRLLWAASRKNNFEIDALEQKTLDAERRLKEVYSQVEETNEIVTDQWIQIQQFEQAIHMAEVQVSKIRKELWGRCPFLKTLKGILDPYVPRDESMLGYCKSQAMRLFAAAKHYHHKKRKRKRRFCVDASSACCSYVVISRKTSSWAYLQMMMLNVVNKSSRSG